MRSINHHSCNLEVTRKRLTDSNRVLKPSQKSLRLVHFEERELARKKKKHQWGFKLKASFLGEKGHFKVLVRKHKRVFKLYLRLAGASKLRSK